MSDQNQKKYRLGSKASRAFFHKENWAKFRYGLGRMGVIFLVSLFVFSWQDKNSIEAAGPQSPFVYQHQSQDLAVGFGQKEDPARITLDVDLGKKTPLTSRSSQNIRMTLGQARLAEESHSKSLQSSTQARLGKLQEIRALPSLQKIDNQDQVVYENILPGVDLRYAILSKPGVKEEIILQAPPKDSPACKSYQDQGEQESLSASLQTLGQTVSLSQTVGQQSSSQLSTDEKRDCIELWDEYRFDLHLDPGVELRYQLVPLSNTTTKQWYFVDQQDNYLAHIDLPFAIDNLGARTNNVFLEKEGDEFVLRVDTEWLMASERHYPVIIDPTIVQDSSVDFSTGLVLNHTQVVDSGQIKVINKSLSCDQYTVALWHMEGDWMDSCNGHNGSANGATFNTTDTQVGEESGSFDGSNDYVNISDHDNLTTNKGLTIEGWFKFNNVGTNVTLVAKYNNTSWAGVDAEYVLGRAADNKIDWVIFDDSRINSTYSWNYIGKKTIQTIEANRWYHIAATWDGTANAAGISIYIDGQQVSTTNYNSGTFENMDNTSEPVFLGSQRLNGSNTLFFSGLIDEVRISNIARTPTEIQKTAELPSRGIYESSIIDFGKKALLLDASWLEKGVATGDAEIPFDNTGLVAQWNFNETSGTAAADATGNGHTGTLTNFANTTGQDAAIGSGWTSDNRRWGAGALMFDGVNDYVSVGNINLGKTHTVSFWGKSQNTGSPIVIGKSDTSPTHAFYFWSNQVWYRPSVSNDVIWPHVLENDGQWHHYAISRNGTSVTFYYDGVSQGVKTLTADIDLQVDRIAHHSYLWKGDLDAIQIYSRALTPAEILANYQAGNIQFQVRTGADNTPYDGDWSAWQPVGGVETLDSMDSNFTTNSTPVVATGGEVTMHDGYTIHTFINDGTFTVTSGTVNAEVLVVAGGGGGGADMGGGGGGGGVIYDSSFPLSPGSYSVVIGEGGAGAPDGVNGAKGSNGTDSTFDTITAVGGGGGGSNIYNGHGLAGGSGGGASGYQSGAIGGTGIDGQGYKGGNNGGLYYSGGGGGAGGPGVNGSNQADGGVGIPNDILGVNYYWGGGGGGSGYSRCGGNGGAGGGGGGAVCTTIGGSGLNFGLPGGGGSTNSQTNRPGGNAGANTGGGGGGGSHYSINNYGGNGGSGIVIVRYRNTTPNWLWNVTSDGLENTNGFPQKREDSVLSATSASTGSMKVSIGSVQDNSNLIAHWSFDETNGDLASNGCAGAADATDICDSSGNAHHGEINGTGLATGVVDGIKGKAREFNGTDDYITVPDSDDWHMADRDFAVSMWYYTNTLSNAGDLIVQRTIAGAWGPWHLHRNNSSLFLYLSSNNVNGVLAIQADGVFMTHKWYHVAFTRNGNTFTLYVDGKVVGTYTSSLIFANHSTPLKIGGSGAGYHNVEGRLDEISIYNSNLTATQIAELYRLGRDHSLNRTLASPVDLTDDSLASLWVAGDRPGTYLDLTFGESKYANYQPDANTVALWHLDEEGETTDLGWVKDSSGNGHHGQLGGGTATNVPSSVQAKMGKGRDFDGVNDLISLPNAAFPFGSSDFTISAWIDLEGTSTCIMCSYNVSTLNGFYFTTGAGQQDRLGFNIYNNSSSPSFALTSPANSLSPEGWQYVTVTRNANEITLYVNGKSVVKGSTALAISNSSVSLFLGIASTIYTSYSFNGLIDEVRISNIARSPAEIRAAYEIGRRTHPITIDFAASGHVDNILTSSGDTDIAYTAQSYGSTTHRGQLFAGDTIIVRETVAGTEYIAQGTVTSLTDNANSTTATVASWQAGSTFPSGAQTGFSANATIFKWQQEFIDLRGIFPDQADAIDELSLRLTNGHEGRTVYLDEMNTVSNYLTNPIANDLSSISPASHFQYRTIFSGYENYKTPLLDSFGLDYILNPDPPIHDVPLVVDTNQIDWQFIDQADNEDGFRIFDVSDNQILDCPGGLVGIGASAFCSESGLQPNTQYTRKITAYNQVGDSDYSLEQSVYTWALPPLSATISQETSDSFRITVEPEGNPSMTEYLVQVGAQYYDPSTESLSLTEVWSTRASLGDQLGALLTGLTPGLSYEVKIQARNGDLITTAWSDSQVADTLAVIPAVPIFIDKGGDNIQLAIDPGLNSSITEYAIYENTTNQYVNSTNGHLTETTPQWADYTSWGEGIGVTIQGLQPGTLYEFQVIARNQNNLETALSPILSVFTSSIIINPPTGSIAVLSNNELIDLSLVSNAQSSVELVLLKEQATGRYIAEFEYDFSLGNADLTGVIYGSSQVDSWAYVHGLSGLVSQFTLYIPKSSFFSNSLRICPGAIDENQIYENCPNQLIVWDGYNQGGVQVSFVSGQEQWMVKGLTSTGGQNIPELPIPPLLEAPLSGIYNVDSFKFLMSAQSSFTTFIEMELDVVNSFDSASLRTCQSSESYSLGQTWTCSQQFLEDGTWYWRARSRDSLNQLSPWSTPISFTIELSGETGSYYHSGIREKIRFQSKIILPTSVNVDQYGPSCVYKEQPDICDFRFRIFDAKVDGNQLWVETHSDVEIGDYDGVFTLELGSINPFSEALLDFGRDDLWLEFSFDADGNQDFDEDDDGIEDEIFSPRSRLNSVPQSFSAKQVVAQNDAYLLRLPGADMTFENWGFNPEDSGLYFDSTQNSLQWRQDSVSRGSINFDNGGVYTSDDLFVYDEDLSQYLGLTSLGVDSTNSGASVIGASLANSSSTVNIQEALMSLDQRIGAGGLQLSTCPTGSVAIGVDASGSLVCSIATENLEGVNQVVVGPYNSQNTCALMTSGEVFCFGGSQSDNILGIGDLEDRIWPVRIPLPTAAIELVSGQEVVYAILQNSQVWRWGHIPSGGQLPEPILRSDGSPLNQVVSVVTSQGGDSVLSTDPKDQLRESACAMVDGGQVYCWGGNASGQLGQGVRSLTNHLTSQAYPATSSTLAYWPLDEVVAGSHSDMSGGSHQLTAISTSTATSVFSYGQRLSGLSSLTVNDSPSWALGADFTLSMWLYPESLNNFSLLSQNQDVNNFWDWGWDSVTGFYLTINEAGANSTIQIMDNSVLSLNTWQLVTLTYDGQNYRFYVDHQEVANLSSLQQIFDLNAPLSIGSSQGKFLVGIVDDIRILSKQAGTNRIYSWWSQGQAFLNPGYFTVDTDQDFASPVKDEYDNFLDSVINIEMSGGRNASVCAVKTDSSLWCWGANGSGQLGLGHTIDSFFAQEVNSWGGIQSLSSTGGGDSPYGHRCLITTDGQIYCWGDNSRGQLGLGHTQSKALPTLLTFPINGPREIKTSGGYFGTTYVLTNDGKIYSWGDNSFGQVGNGTIGSDVTEPSLIDQHFFVDLRTVSSPSSSHVCALNQVGQLFCWGSNDYGQLGIGSTTDQLEPIQVSGLFDIGQIDLNGYPGHEASCAIDLQKRLSCFGGYQIGFQSNRDNVNSTTPQFIQTLLSEISANQSQSSSVLVGGGLADVINVSLKNLTIADFDLKINSPTCDSTTIAIWSMDLDWSDSCSTYDFTPSGGVDFESDNKKLGSAAGVFDSNLSSGLHQSSVLSSLGNVFSIEGWFQVHEFTGVDQFIFASDDATAYSALYLDGSTNKLVARVNGSSLMTSESSLVLNQWYHFSLTSDGQTVQLWLNSRLTMEATFGSNQPAGGLYIGRATGGSYFQGLLDEFSISSINKTSFQIENESAGSRSDIYTSPVIDLGSSVEWEIVQWIEHAVATGDGQVPWDDTDLIGRWNFDELSGASCLGGQDFCDSSGTNHAQGQGFTDLSNQDVVSYSGYTGLQQRFGQGALQFDGLDDVAVVSGNEADFDFIGDFSVEFWVKPIPSSSKQVWISKNDGTSSDGWYLVSQDSGLGLNKSIGFYTGSLSNMASASTNIYDGQWHYITAVYEAGVAKSLYIDGQLEAQEPVGNLTNNDQPLEFGRLGSGSLAWGTLDSLRIYKRALTKTEIMANYQVGDIQLQTRSGLDDDPYDGGWEDWLPADQTIVSDLDARKNGDILLSKSSRGLNLQTKIPALDHGDGSDGNVIINKPTNLNTDNIQNGRSCLDGGDAVSYVLSSDALAGSTSIVINQTPSSGCLEVGDEILIIILQGDEQSFDQVGTWETVHLTGIAGNVLQLETSLQFDYLVSESSVMIQRVPNYSQMTVSKEQVDLTKDGSSSELAGRSCLALLQSGQTTDGVYWIDPDGQKNQSSTADLTSPTTPVTSSSEYGHVSNLSSNIVDNDTADGDNYHSGSGGGYENNWVMLDLETPQKVNKLRYMMHSSGYNPYAIRVDGSHDASRWTELSPAMNVANASYYGTNLWLDFSFYNDTAFRYYRIHTVENSNNAYWVIQQIELMYQDLDPIQVYCDMTRDGGGWAMGVKSWYGQAAAIYQRTQGVGSVSDALTLKGNFYKLSDDHLRSIIGPGQNFDVMADQAGYNSGYSTGNYEYVVLRNYTGYWQYGDAVSSSTTTTRFQSYRLSDGALAHSYNLLCGNVNSAGVGINCYDVLEANPQGGASCDINMGTSSSAAYHWFSMALNNTDTYLYACNGAQHSSSYNMNHRWWFRERTESPRLYANSWDGKTGGVLFFRVQGTLQVDGAIAVDGQGFKGGMDCGTGAWTQHLGGDGGEGICGQGGAGSASSGQSGAAGGGSGSVAGTVGGGGICGAAGGGYTSPGNSYVGGAGGGGGAWSGGGGGAGYGTAGQGGNGITPATSGLGYLTGQASGHSQGGSGGGGGQYGDHQLQDLFFGSGGGHGGHHASSNYCSSNQGGDGGGIIYISAQEVILSDDITAKGQDGGDYKLTWGAGGGGGSGGSIRIETENWQRHRGTVLSVSGGVGGVGRGYAVSNNGGAGGSGRVAIYSQEKNIDVRLSQDILNQNSGYVFTADSTSAGSDPAHVADQINRNTTTDWASYGVQTASATKHWWAVDFGQDRKVTHFGVSGYPGGSYNPSGTWHLEGSSDGTNWSTIWSGPSSQWTIPTQGSYPPSNIIEVQKPDWYQHYRIYSGSWTNGYMLIMNVAMYEGYTPQAINYQDILKTPLDLQNDAQTLWLSSSRGVDSGLVGYWSFDETNGDETGFDIIDQSGRGHHGQLCPSSNCGLDEPQVTNSLWGKARLFDGANDYIQVPSSFDWSFTNKPFAASVWFKHADGQSTGGEALIWTAAGGYDGLGVQILDGSTNQLSITVGSNTPRLVTVGNFGTTWHHLVLTKLPDNTIEVYWDGQLKDSWSNTNSLRADTLLIGALDVGSIDKFFQGSIDEVRLYNTALSSTQVSNLYISENQKIIHEVSSFDASDATMLSYWVAGNNPGTFLSLNLGESYLDHWISKDSSIATWHFDQITNSTQKASFVNSDSSFHQGQLGGGNASRVPSSSTGYQNMARRFDGVDDYILVPDHDQLDPATLTLSVWVKPESFHNGTIIDKGGSSGYTLRLDGATQKIQFLDRGTTNTLTSRQTYQVGRWQHIMITAGSTGMRLYINGQLDSTKAVSYASPNTSSNFFIGSLGASTDFYHGHIDELQIINTILTTGEIKKWYDQALKTFPVTIDFGANLNAPIFDGVLASTDLSFRLSHINGQDDSASLTTEDLSIGDRIILQENFLGTTYTAQGKVNAIDISTNLVSVYSWQTGSTFPPNGFSKNTDVFKWQQEFVNLSEIPASQLDSIKSLSWQFIDTRKSASIWIDQVEVITSHLTDPTGSLITSSPNPFWQYRIIGTTSDSIVWPWIDSSNMHIEVPSQEALARQEIASVLIVPGTAKSTNLQVGNHWSISAPLDELQFSFDDVAQATLSSDGNLNLGSSASTEKLNVEGNVLVSGDFIAQGAVKGMNISGVSCPENEFVIGFDDSGQITCGGRLGNIEKVFTAKTLATSCAINDQQKLYCWGDNQYGQLGIGHSDSQVLPVKVPFPDDVQIVDLQFNAQTVYALDSQGRLWAWGKNDQGQLGDTTTIDRFIPGLVPSLVSVKSFGVTYGHSVCALVDVDGDGAGQVFCWGGNSRSEVGNGLGLPVLEPTPVQTTGGSQELIGDQRSLITVSMSSDLIPAIYNDLSGLVDGVIGTNFKNYFNSVALDGNQYIQFDFNSSRIVQEVRFEQASPLSHGQWRWQGSYDGSVWVDIGGDFELGGSNSQLMTSLQGNISSFNSYRLVSVSGNTANSDWIYEFVFTTSTGISLSDVVDITDLSAAGGQSASVCALDINSDVWCWGAGQQGQLASGQAKDSPFALKVSGDLDTQTVTSLWAAALSQDAAVGIHRCAIVSSGALWCWGANQNGQLGMGSTSSYESTPINIGLGQSITSMALHAGTNSSSMALTQAGEVIAFGSNSGGQIGQPTLGDILTPNTIGGLSDIQELRIGGSSGQESACALTITGKVYCFGQGSSGQLGNGYTSYKTTPTSILSSEKFTSLDLSVVDLPHVCALSDKGFMHCWGAGDQGQLGIGSKSSTSIPVFVKTMEKEKALEISRPTTFQNIWDKTPTGELIYAAGDVDILSGGLCIDNGSISCPGDLLAGHIYFDTAHASYADIAEYYPSTKDLKPGEVTQLAEPTKKYDWLIEPANTTSGSQIIGIVSHAPGLTLADPQLHSNEFETEVNTYPIALSGRVPLRTWQLPIINEMVVGDVLSSSQVAGLATQPTTSGWSVGRALTDFPQNCQNVEALKIDEISQSQPNWWRELDVSNNCLQVDLLELEETLWPTLDHELVEKALELNSEQLIWQIGSTMTWVEMSFQIHPQDQSQIALLESNSISSIQELTDIENLMANSNLDQWLNQGSLSLLDLESQTADFEDITISRPVVSSSTAGQAQIIQGDSLVRVTFPQRYNNKPIVVVTPVGQVEDYIVTQVDLEGFSIKLDDRASFDQLFMWRVVQTN